MYIRNGIKLTGYVEIGGISYPLIWWNDPEQRVLHGVTLVADPPLPDSRLYTYTTNPDGTYATTAKSAATIAAEDAELAAENAARVNRAAILAGEAYVATEKSKLAAIEAGAQVNEVVATDPRLSDPRPPITHTHPYESANANIQSHIASAHAPAGATVNSSDAALLNRANHTGTQLAATISDPNSIGNNAHYRTILESAGSHIAGRVAGTYGMAMGDPIAISGTGTLYPLNTIYIAAADYPTVNGLAAKLRIRAQLFTNDVAPTGNFTIGLYPITRPATSGGAGLCIYTLGAVVAGSNGATFTAPLADLLPPAVAGADFNLPADGHYVLGVVTTATVATSSLVHVVAKLLMRNA